MTLLDALRILGPEEVEGDREAAGECLQAKLEQLAKARNRYYRNQEEREDAVMRCLERILARTRPFTGNSDGETAAYLRNMLDNEFRDRLRRKKVASAPRGTGISQPTGFEDGEDDEHGTRVLIDPEGPEDIVGGEYDVARATRTLFEEIVPALDGGNAQSRTGEIIGQLRRLATGNATMEELVAAEGGDFTRARNRIYQNAHRALKRLETAIRQRDPPEQELLLALMERLRIRKK